MNLPMSQLSATEIYAVQGGLIWIMCANCTLICWEIKEISEPIALFFPQYSLYPLGDQCGDTSSTDSPKKRGT